MATALTFAQIDKLDKIKLPESFKGFRLLIVDRFADRNNHIPAAPSKEMPALPAGFSKIKAPCIASPLQRELQRYEDESRSYRLLYLDRDDWAWNALTESTDADDLGDPVAIIIDVTSEGKTFSKSAFLTPAGTRLKKFQDGTEIKNFTLRHPQTEALEKLTRVLGRAEDGSRFLVVLPTGVGKSVVIALAPFCLGSTKVICILPGTTLAQQLKRDLSEYYNGRHPIGRTGNVNVNVTTFESTDKHAPDAHADIVITNIQALVAQTSKDENKDDEEPKLRPAAQQLFKTHKPNLLVADEGHHFPANSWKAVEAAAIVENPSCKAILLTATPIRGDGRTYGLPKVAAPEEFFYICHRSDAVASKYIKETQFRPLRVPNDKIVQKYHVENFNAYVDAIVMPAVRELQGLRGSCEGKPIRMLITVNSNKAAQAVAKYLNQRSAEQRWGFFAAAITGDTDDANTQKFLNDFAAPSLQHKYVQEQQVDIAVQCRMLGEGYNNPWIAQSVFIHPPMTVSRVSQYHGRAVRKPPSNAELKDNPRANVAYLYYPEVENVVKVIDQYKEGADEREDNLFAEAFPDLRRANTKVAKLFSTQATEMLKANYHEYHGLYAEQRRNWKVIPAEKLADDIYQDLIADSSAEEFFVIDFGCGLDGLFEEQLAKRVAERVQSGKVTAVAVDVVRFDRADALGASPESGTAFSCPTFEGDYGKILEVDLFKSSFKEHTFDAAVFCLSIMACDALSAALLTASRVVKAFSPIFIVLTCYQFGGMPGSKDMEPRTTIWGKHFSDRTGFAVNNIAVDHMMVYIRVANVGYKDVKELPNKLKNVSMKSLKEAVNASMKAKPAAPCLPPLVEGAASSGKNVDDMPDCMPFTADAPGSDARRQRDHDADDNADKQETPCVKARKLDV